MFEFPWRLTVGTSWNILEPHRSELACLVLVDPLSWWTGQWTQWTHWHCSNGCVHDVVRKGNTVTEKDFLGQCSTYFLILFTLIHLGYLGSIGLCPFKQVFPQQNASKSLWVITGTCWSTLASHFALIFVLRLVAAPVFKLFTWLKHIETKTRVAQQLPRYSWLHLLRSQEKARHNLCMARMSVSRCLW